MRLNNMNFSQNRTIEHIGEKIGFIFAYFLFTTILFFVFKVTYKLPKLGYFYVIGITLIIVFLGSILKRFIK